MKHYDTVIFYRFVWFGIGIVTLLLIKHEWLKDS